jgi:hypothetical protein
VVVVVPCLSIIMMRIHSFISLRFLGGGVVGWWCLSGVLWCSLFSSLDIGLTLLLRVLEEPLCLLTV